MTMAKAPKMVRRVTREIRYLRALLRDPRTPPSAKWLIGAGLAYLFSPIDLIPDVLPIIGQLDDLLIVPTLVMLGLRVIPEDVKRANRSRTRTQRPGSYALDSGVEFQTAALQGTFGVEVVGVDAGSAHPSEILLSLLELVLENRVVVSKAAIGAKLVDPLRLSFTQTPAGLPEMVTHLPPRFDGEFQVEITTRCGAVTFVDLTAAYDALTEPRKLFIDGLQVVPAERRLLAAAADSQQITIGKTTNARADYKSAPLVVRHPVTGCKTLVQTHPATELVGLSRSQSADLIGELAEHQSQPKFLCEYKHVDGDVIARDSASTAMLCIE